MNRCEAPNCKMRTYAPTAEQLKMANNNYVISFHKFPDDPDRRQSWISAANKPSWRPPLFNSSLCSLHFRDDCFDENNELYDHAVPSIFFDNFGSYIRELVKNLDLQCKLDDDNSSKASKGSEDALNTSVESNQNGLLSESDEENLSFVECEEVVIFDENSQLGIENISIPELDETFASDAVESDERIPVPNHKVDAPKIDLNNIVDIRISNLTNKGLIKNIAESQSTAPAVESSAITSAKSDIVSTLPIKLTVVQNKPTAPPSAVPQPNTPSSNVPNLSLPSSNAKQYLGISSSRLTVPTSTLTNVQTESVFISRSNNSAISTSNVFQRATTSSCTAGTTKPTTMSIASIPKSSLAAQNSFSVMEPATKVLVLQLLEIVRMANTLENKGKVGPTISSYLVTSRSVDVDSSAPCEIIHSSDVIRTVANYIKDIKEETFVKPDNVSIICGSPAIFLLKNITVEECDPNMNCVYIITSENLLPHLYNLKLKSSSSDSSNQQTSNNATTQKSLQVGDLVSSANPQAVLSIQNPPNTTNNAAKINVASKPINVSSPADKLSNAVPSPSPGVGPRTSSSISISNAAKPPANNAISSSSLNQAPVDDFLSDFSDDEPMTIEVISDIDDDEQTECIKVSYTTSAEPQANYVNATMTKSTAGGSNVKATVTKSTASSNVNTAPAKLVIGGSKMNVMATKSTAGGSDANATVTKSTASSNVNVAPAKSTTSSSNMIVMGTKSTAGGSILNPELTKSAASSNVNATMTKSTATSSISNATLTKSTASGSNVNATLTKSTASSNVNTAMTKSVTSSSISNTMLTKSTTSDSVNPGFSYSNCYVTSVNPSVNRPPLKTVVAGPLSKPSTNNSISNTAVAKPLANTPNFNAAVAKPSISNTNPTISNAARTKPLANTPNFRTAMTKPSVNIPKKILSEPVNQTASNTNFSLPQTKTISPVKVTPLPIATIANTIGSIPNTPLSRVLQSSTSTSNASKIIKPVMKIAAQPATQTTRPSVYIGNTSQLQFQSSPVRVSSAPMCAPSPYIIPGSSVSYGVKPKQPPNQTAVAKSTSSLTTQTKPNPQPFIFQPIQPTSFDTNLKTCELLTCDSFASSKPSTSAATIQSQPSVDFPVKRKWDEIDDADDDDPFFASCNNENYDKEFLEQQRKEIANCESNIIHKEREINNLKKKLQALKKRLNSVKNPNDTKTDEQLIEEILSKYIDSDGVQFFIGQMKVAGKTYTQFRWSEEDKLFALGLLYKNPVEYNVLFQKYVLPSDKTLNKFVSRVKKAEMQDTRNTSNR